MTQYFEDWASDSLNAAPDSSRWTPYGFADHSAYLTGKVQDEGSGIRAVELRDTGWGGYNVGYTRAELGTYSPGGSDTSQIYLVFRFPGGQGSSAGGIKWGSYYALPTDNTHWAIEYGLGGGYVAGSSSVSYTVTPNTWWKALLERTGAGVFSLYLAQLGSSFGSPVITSSADTSATTGALGFFGDRTYYNSIDVRAIGIGTANDPAPTSGGGPPPVTPVLMGQIVM